MAILPRADWVAVMESNSHGIGRVAQMGRYDDLKKQQGPFRSLFDEVGSAETQPRAHTPTPLPTTPSFKPPTSAPKESEEYEKKTSQDPMEEDRQTGPIPWSIYATYLSAMGNPMWSLLFASMLILTQVATVGNNLLLGFWSADSWSLTQGEYMAVYAGLGVGIGLFTVSHVSSKLKRLADKQISLVHPILCFSLALALLTLSLHEHGSTS